MSKFKEWFGKNEEVMYDISGTTIDTPKSASQAWTEIAAEIKQIVNK